MEVSSVLHLDVWDGRKHKAGYLPLGYLAAVRPLPLGGRVGKQIDMLSAELARREVAICRLG